MHIFLSHLSAYGVLLEGKLSKLFLAEGSEISVYFSLFMKESFEGRKRWLE